MSKDNWTPDSWKNHQANQQPQYEDKELLNEALSEVGLLPPLVFAGEVDELKETQHGIPRRRFCTSRWRLC